MLEAIHQFHFLRPTLLLLAPVALVIWWLWKRNRDPLRGWRAQMDPDLLNALTTGSSTRSMSALLLASWIVAVVIAAGPSWREEPDPFTDEISPLFVLLKADRSMDQPDPAPSRMERAQLSIHDLAAARKSAPLGLIVYAGSAHLVLPPTKDTAVVGQMAGEISPDIMPEPGNRLDRAIALAAASIGDTAGTLLIVTDSAVPDVSQVQKTWQEAGSPKVIVLAVSGLPDLSQELRDFAKGLEAELIPLSDDDRDIDSIVAAANTRPVARKSDGSAVWQDNGYYFLPVLALLALIPFRRVTSTLAAQ